MQTKDKLAKMEHVKIAHDHVDFTDRIKKGTGTSALITGDIEHNTAVMDYAHAEGSYTAASEKYSHAEGRNSTASGEAAHVEGWQTTASGIASHAEGTATKATYSNAHAEGGGTVASAPQAHAEGGGTTASGPSSHSEGGRTMASGEMAHAEGEMTTASGRNSHAEGWKTKASSNNQHVSGKYNIEDTNGTYAEIIGNGAADNARSNARTLDWNGNEVLAGKLTLGANPTNDMDAATKKMVDDVDMSDRIAKGTGTKSIIESNLSHNNASGDFSHAEGHTTTASGVCSHAEGMTTVASGSRSHAENDYTVAAGNYSHAEGWGTRAQRRSQHVFGEFNRLDTGGSTASDRGTYVEIVGRGYNNDNRVNARTLDWSGNEVLAGKLTVGAAPTADMDVATKKYIDDIISALRTELGLT